MTPEQVQNQRKVHRIHSGDLYSTIGITEIVEREKVIAQLSEEAAEIKEILDCVPEFTENCDYKWAADPSSYDAPSEAAFQRRMLLMLAKYWVESPQARQQLPGRISGIIALQEFIMRYSLTTPKITTSTNGCAVLSIPASFFELALWTFTGLRCWCATRLHPTVEDNVDGWSIVTKKGDFGTALPFDHVTTKELIARVLADRGKDRSLYGVNAVLLIRERVPSLLGEGVELNPDGINIFEQNASYMLGEFCIAHELGHKIAGHIPAAENNMDPAKETEADLNATLLLAMSSGKRPLMWDEEILPPLVQAAIGLAVFDCFLSVKDTLVNGLKLRENALCNACVRDSHSLEAEKLRAGIARLHNAELHKILARSGQLHYAQRIATLIDNNNAYLRDLAESIRIIPDEDILLALRTAEESLMQED